MGSRPSQPALPPPPPPAPDLADDLIQQQAKRKRAGQGIQSTFLTGPRGVQSPTASAQPKTLLGS